MPTSYTKAPENLTLTKSGQYEIDDQNRIWDTKTGGQLDEAKAFGELGLNTNFLPKKGAGVTENPNDPLKYLSGIENQDPITKFNFALLDMLSKAQGAGGNVELFKQQRALQRKAIERTSAPTPEELKVLSPGQQSAIRSGSVQALEPEIDAVASEIKARDSRLSNFERILGDIRQIGGDIAANIAPPKEVLEGYKFMIRAGADPTSIPTEIRNKVMGGMTPDDWDAWKASVAKAKSSGSGGITDLQGFDRELKLANDFEKYAKDSRSALRGIGVVEIGFEEALKGLKEGKPLNAQSQAVIIGFNKLLDPTSVVRESEYARTPEGASLINRLEGYKIRIMQGGAGLNEAELRGLRDTAVALLSGYQASMLDFAERTKQQAAQLSQMSGGRYGNLDNILTPDVLSMLNKQDEVVVKHPNGQTYTFPNQDAADKFKQEVEQSERQSILWQ